MVTKKALTEAEALEQYRVALNNVEVQPEIAGIMAEFGYDATVVAQGKSLLAETRSVYDLNKTEDDETSDAYTTFSSIKEYLEDTYTLHRKKAKVIFRTNPKILEKLEITGGKPRVYLPWLESLKRFYTVANNNENIKVKMQRLRITDDELMEATTKISELEAARANYLREKGESQSATKAKDDAFAKMDEWMRDFYAVAKIALEDKPQLLEALGKMVRS
jgi:ribosome-associated translation inhibitor RaiA